MLYLLDKSFIFSDKLTVLKHNIYNDTSDKVNEIITSIKNKNERYSFISKIIDDAILTEKQQIYCEIIPS